MSKQSAWSRQSTSSRQFASKPSDGELEVAALPKGWGHGADPNDKYNQVLWFKEEDTNINFNDHPYLGKLPNYWILRVKETTTDENGNAKEVFEYYNKQTKGYTQKNPGGSKAALLASQANLIDAAKISGSLYKPDPRKRQDLTRFKRAKIGKTDLSKNYYKLKELSGGAMNAGVFVVCLRSQPSNLQVQKNFKDDDEETANTEIMLLHRLRNDSLSMYTAAFINFAGQLGLKAAVWVEFCDLGSLQDLIDGYTFRRKGKDFGEPEPGKKKKKTFLADPNTPQIPEAFIWHAFLSACDGIAYLCGGKSYMNTNDYTSDPDWVPILHRDIKPENFLLKSRSTLGSTKYPYCVISDFGLAIEDNGKNCDHEGGFICGTCSHYAPELMYPKGTDKTGLVKFYENRHHTFKSDMWALGACIYHLTHTQEPNWFPHLTLDGYNPKPRPLPNGQPISEWLIGLECYKFGEKPVGIIDCYSESLRDVIHQAMEYDPARRPDAIGMMEILKKAKKPKKIEPLPEWALFKHEYHHKAREMRMMGAPGGQIMLTG